MTEAERWHQIAGLNYEVSDHGRIRHAQFRRILKLRCDRDGYLRVTLSDRRAYLMHVLVLTAFAGPRPIGFVTRHLNGKPGDNRLENLAWGTQAENYRDMVSHGRALHGVRHPNAKLTYQDVEAIRKAKGPYGFVTRLARGYGVSQSSISQIRSSKYWSRHRVRDCFPTGKRGAI